MPSFKSEKYTDMPLAKSPMSAFEEVKVMVGSRANGSCRDITAFKKSFIPVKSLMSLNEENNAMQGNVLRIRDVLYKR